MKLKSILGPARLRSLARTPVRFVPGSARFIAAFGCSLAAAYAQPTSWNAVGTGNFITPANWTTGVPSSIKDTFITNGTAGTPTIVNLNGAAGDVANLTIGANNTLNVNTGSAFSVAGTSVTNNGAFNVTAGSGANTVFNFNNNVALTGTGILTLSYGDHNGTVTVGGSGTLSNTSTIRGDGGINLSLTNGVGGVVNANVSGQTLSLGGPSITNTGGLLEATNGGALQISSNVANTGGNITGNNGTVNVSSTITGGTINTVGTGVVRTTGAATLQGVTVSNGSTYTGALGTVTTLGGSINNTGNIQINGGFGNNTFLNVNNLTTLQGGGTVTLNSGDNNGRVYLQPSGGPATLTNTDNHIQGYGQVGNGALTIANGAAGVIDANASTQTLVLNGLGGIDNAGLLKASNGGTLQITNGIRNAGANITADGGTVLVNGNATIQGGTLNTLNGGVMQTGNSGTANLDGSTLGAITLSAGSTWTSDRGSVTNVQGTLNNLGHVQVNGGFGNNTFINLAGNTTLQGGGTVTLDDGDNNGRPYIQGTGLTLTNVNNTIQGAGTIGNSSLAVVNGGQINANLAGHAIILNGGGNVTNTGLLEATNGGTLQITNTVANVGANITANGGNVLINSNAVIQGGTLNTLNSGTMGTGINGTATLDGSTLGAITLSTGSTWTSDRGSFTTVQGTINNQGNIQVNGGNGANTTVALAANTTLQGGGTVTLNNGDNNGRPYIQGNGMTLTNVNNTIHGAGTIGNGTMAVVNNAAGVINADISGQTMLLNGTGNVVNAGLLEATNGATLQITNTVANAGANITANAGTVLVNGSAVIQGGTLNTLNGGTMGTGVNGSATLDGSTLGALTLSTNSTWTSERGSNTTLQGVINNQGSIQVNGGNGANTFVALAGDTTLQGGGTVTLNNGDNNGRPFISGNGMTLTNVNNTIHGAGTIGNGSLSFVNNPAGVVNADITGQVMVVNASSGTTNTGLLEATNGGVLQLTTGVVNNQNGNITASTGTVNVNTTIQGGTLNGGNLQTQSNATLDGSAHGPLTISTGSTYTGGLGTTTNLAGTINNQGNIQINSGSGNNTALNIVSNTTLQGGGTLTLDNGDNNGQVFVSGAATLTNSNHTIQGAGTIGGGGLNVVNDPAGTILANKAGSTLLISGSGNVTNNGTMQANAGSTLQVASNLTNFAGSTLTGGTYVVNGTAAQTGTMQLSTLGNNVAGEIVNNAANIVLNGPTANTRLVDAGGNDALKPLANNTGSLTLNGGYGFTAVGNLANSGTVHVGGAGSSLTVSPGNTYTQTAGLTKVDAGGTVTAGTAQISGGTVQLAGGTFNATTLTNAAPALIVGNGTINARPTNLGTIEASGGTLTVSNGISGPSGTVKVDAGATLNLSGGASSTAGTLAQNGTLALGTNNVTVSTTYTNANFGVGNSFDAHAGVTGTGQINASGNTNQAITGATVTNGTTATPQLGGFGNIRTGQTSTVTYNVVNTGSTGPSLIGALQTSVNGGNITDSRLSGSGVTAGNFGPLTSGQSQSYSVTLNGTTAGAVAPGQTVHIANNFDNVADQTLTLGGGAVYQAAQASTLPATVNLGNVHVGATASTTLGITNVAPNTGGFTETLGATATGTTGAATTSGSISGLAQGGTSNAITVGLNTATAGALSGTATLGFTSTEINGSGLGTIGVGSQTVTVTGAAYRLAQADLGTLAFGNVLVGSTQTRTLTVTNGAVADLFSEGLNASFGSVTGVNASRFTATGAINNLAAGLSDGSHLVVTLNTSATGLVAASVQVLLASNGAGTSGLGLTALPTQNVALSGQITGLVGSLASASPATPNPVNLGNVRIGAASPTQALTLTNTAAGPAEGLNANFSGVSAGLTATGSFTSLAAGATNGTSLVVGMNTATAGLKNGTATIGLTSDGTFNNGVATTLSSQTVNVNGAVYQTAQASTLPTTVNLGTVRTGTVVNTALSLGNIAPLTGGYTETLGASFGTVGAGLTGTGAITGLAAGAAPSSALNVGFTAGAAGAFNRSATVNFSTEAINGSGLGTLGIGSQTVNFTANVNALADLQVLLSSGFNFTITGAHSGQLDFGSLASGSGALFSTLSLLNNVFGPADSLVGSFNSAGLLGGPFSLIGGSAFNLGAGASQAFQLSFNTNFAAGTYTATLILNDASHNAFQSDLGLSDYSLTIRGTINAPSTGGGGITAVPEPSTYGLCGALALVVAVVVRRRVGRRG